MFCWPKHTQIYNVCVISLYWQIIKPLVWKSVSGNCLTCVSLSRTDFFRVQLTLTWKSDLMGVDYISNMSPESSNRLTSQLHSILRSLEDVWSHEADKQKISVYSSTASLVSVAAVEQCLRSPLWLFCSWWKSSFWTLDQNSHEFSFERFAFNRHHLF